MVKVAGPAGNEQNKAGLAPTGTSDAMNAETPRKTAMLRVLAAPLLGLLLLLATPGTGVAAEVTNSADNLRTGWYPSESSITPQLVSGGSFGQVWSANVEGQVYAQPLLDDGTLFVATEDNRVYGLDPATGALQWSKPVNLGTPWNPAEIGCADLTPSVGVTSTPVIDPSTHIAYLTYKTYASGTSGPVVWYMDALSVSTGAQEPGFPVRLEGSAQNAPGQTFDPQTELQRPGLLLMEGVVYAAFGSDCDHPPWQGWVFGVSTTGAVKARWSTVESGEGAGIWQSGAGLTSDRPGSILLSTGNGGAPTEPAPGTSPPPNLGESIVRLQVQSDGSLKPTDFFAPYDAASLDSWDADFASGGVTGLPEETFGTAAIPHLAVAVGKDGYVYLLNRDNLGGIGQGPSGSDKVVQRIGPYGGVWSRPGVWPGEGGWVYIPTASGGTSAAGTAGNLRVYSYGLSGTGAPSLSLQATSSEEFGFSSSAPVITSNGTASGSALVWIVWSPNAYGEGAQLRAYDPVPVGGQPVLRWSAPVGTSAKFAIPGVGAGRLYVGTRDGHVLAFGSPVTPALTAPPTTFPTTTVGESSAPQTVTLTANEPLTVTGIASSSPQFTVGSPSQTLPAALGAGQTIQVPVTFTPATTGSIGGTLTATTSSGKKAAFALSGVGQAAGARLEASPPLVTFGGTAVGGRLSAGATFRNVGGTPLEVKAVQLPEAPFSAEGVPAVGSTIAPGGSITVTVAFEPTATGTFNGQIGLETTGGNKAIGLSGSASTAGALQISEEALEYGTVVVGATTSKSFTVTNTGGTTVTVTKSKPPIGGAFAASTSLPEGTTIPPGASVTETVQFTPSVIGPASGVWLINGDDTSGLHEVRFSGTGVVGEAPAVLTGEASSLTPTGATLNATVNPKGETASDCHFELLSGPSSPRSVPCNHLPGAGNEPVGVSATIEGLTAAGAYTYRINATNPAGTREGAPVAFTTPSSPEGTSPPIETSPSASQSLLGGGTAPSLLGVLAAQEQRASAGPRITPVRRALAASASGVISVGVRCPVGVSSCTGTITLRTRFGVRFLSHGRYEFPVIASGPFALAAGRLTTVRLHVTRSAHALLAGTSALNARAVIVAHDHNGPSAITTTYVTIRLP